MIGWGNYSAGTGAGLRFARFARIAVFFDGAIGRFECKSRILGAFLQIVSHYDHPGLRCPGCCAISNGKGLDVLSFEVFTLFTLFTVFFDGAGGRFECKNLFVKVQVCEQKHAGIE